MEGSPVPPLVLAAESALHHSAMTTAGRDGRRRGSIIDAMNPMRLVSAFSPKPRQTLRQRGADISPASTELEANLWFAEALRGYSLSLQTIQPWIDRFAQNRMDGSSLLAINSDRDLRTVFGIELKGVRTRLLQDIEHERSSQTSKDSTATVDAMVRQTSHIIVRCPAWSALQCYA
eukprot:COSAG05_NODE_2257_length_3328_cov_26.785819_1_plen_176_part_00